MRQQLVGHHVHFIGIGGTGMSSVARIMLAKGWVVSGSDKAESDATRTLRQLGAQVVIGQDPANLPAPPATIVMTSAIRPDNPELTAARDLGFPVLHRAEALAALMENHRTVSVAGTAGKTSTASMVVSGLRAAGLDPTFAIGGVLNAVGSGAFVGGDDVFVVEADESDGSLSAYSHDVAVVTNIKADHLDYFGTEEAYTATFETMVHAIRPGGVLIVCVDDPGAARLGQYAEARGVRVRRYGRGRADLKMLAFEPTAGGGRMRARFREEQFDVTLSVPGEHMAMNALGAILAGIEIGTPLADMADGIATYEGVRRRFEQKGTAAGVTIYDDYAHHPMKVEAQLQAARELVGSGPDARGRLIVVFQPHMYSRTAMFAAEFGAALALADEVVVLDIYGAREDPIAGVTSELVGNAVNLPAERVHLAQESDALPLLLGIVRDGDLVVTMGAGSVTNLGPQLLAALEHRAAAEARG
ncbi:UDP-N-acetylmuramate--L-alanine ligase [Nocardia beijingensis]